CDPFLDFFMRNYLTGVSRFGALLQGGQYLDLFKNVFQSRLFGELANRVDDHFFVGHVTSSYSGPSKCASTADYTTVRDTDYFYASKSLPRTAAATLSFRISSVPS